MRNALLLVISSFRFVTFRAVVVKAADEKAKRFYEHFGFIQIKGMDMKLVLSTADSLEIILQSLWWQVLWIGNCVMFFGTDDGFNYFSFSTFGYPENRGNKAVSSKREPKREPVSCFWSELICILSTHWKISWKTHW